MKFWNNNSFERDMGYAGASPRPLKPCVMPQIMTNKAIRIPFLCLYLFVFWVPFSEASDPERPHQPVSGTILINLQNYSKYHDFTFSALTKTFHEVAQGKVVREEKNGRAYDICEGSSYRANWEKIRGRQYWDEDQFKTLFGEFDLSNLKRFVPSGKTDCNPKKAYQLRKIKDTAFRDQERFAHDIRYYYFRINEQKTYAVYNLYPGSQALLIDLVNMSVFASFCNQNIDHIVWDRTGAYLAYAKSDSKDYSAKKVITAKNIKSNDVIMEKSLGRYVADIAWNPLSDHIAVLTCTVRMGYSPWEIVAAICGHPVWYRTFYLSIYDITGRELISQKVMGNFADGGGSLIWSDE